MRGACTTRILIIAPIWDAETRNADPYLRIELVESINRILYAPHVNPCLYSLSGSDGRVLLLWLEVCFLREVGGGVRIALHS